MLDPQPVVEPPPLVHHKCHQCGFDLHGRQYGERCPECGTIIERLAPPWWNSESLARIARAAARAKWASLTLMLLPILGLVMAVTGSGRFFSGRGYVLIACAMLLLQGGSLTLASPPLPPRRPRSPGSPPHSPLLPSTPILLLLLFGKQTHAPEARFEKPPAME
jgi:hypothetical protein